MDELLYETLKTYYKTLSYTGYKSYDVVFKLLVTDFIHYVTNSDLRYYIKNEDIKLMQDLLYQFLGSTCEISFPTNNRPCCVCVCCENSTTAPPLAPTSTTSTKPPIVKTYLYLTSNIATVAYVNGTIYDVETNIDVTGNSTITIVAPKIDGYIFNGYYKTGHLLGTDYTLNYFLPSTGINTIELKYEKEGTTTSSTSRPPVTQYYYGAGAAPNDVTIGIKTVDKIFTFTPGKVKSFWVAVPSDVEVINLTSNPDTIPDIHLMEKLSKSMVSTTVSGKNYTIYTFTSAGNLIMPIKTTLS